MSSPEFQLLLSCARPRPNTGSIKTLIGTGIDWQKVLSLAAYNCVRPILAKALTSVGWKEVPRDIQTELSLINGSNAKKNLFFAGELLQLINSFNQHAIPVAAFKGPVLAESLYGQLSLREFSDLDIMVHEADVPRAEDILMERGYEPDFPDRDFRTAFLSYQGQFAFRNGKTGISVDLHWRLSSKTAAFPPRLAALLSREIWSRLEQVKIANRGVPTLSRYDLALFLAAHGTKEGWGSLLWVCDFANLMCRFHDKDWEKVVDRAKRSASTIPLLLAVKLASSLLDAPAPPALRDRASRNRAVMDRAEDAKNRMQQALPAPTRRAEEFDEFLQGLKTLDTLGQKLRPLATLLTTRMVGDYASLPLPKSLWGVYFFTRPFRLAFECVGLMLPPRKSG